MCECVLQSIPSIINADSSYNLTFTYAQTHQTKIEMARKETRTRSHTIQARFGYEKSERVCNAYAITAYSIIRTIQQASDRLVSAMYLFIIVVWHRVRVLV